MAADEKRARSSASGGIPEDIVIDGILVRLPVKSLLRFKSVCKHWLLYIQDPYFADLHYNRSLHHRPQFLITYPCNSLPVIDHKYPDNVLSVNHEGERESINLFDFIVFNDTILSYFHGLILYSEEDGSRRICNPITKQSMVLPDLGGDPPLFNQQFDHYFDIGYDSSTKQYKVLHTHVVVQYYPDLDGTLEYFYGECSIITLGGGGGGGWRKLNQRPPHLLNSQWKAYQNGAVHWRNITQPLDDVPLKEHVIVAFDFTDEKFRVLPLPQSILDSEKDKHGGLIQVMGGHLGLVRRDHNTVDLWVLQDYSKLIWIRKTFLLQENRIPIGALPTGQIIMRSTLNTHPFSLYYYDFVSMASRKVEFTSLPSEYISLGYRSHVTARLFVESLYSWNGRNA